MQPPENQNNENILTENPTNHFQKVNPPSIYPEPTAGFGGAFKNEIIQPTQIVKKSYKALFIIAVMLLFLALIGGTVWWLTNEDKTKPETASQVNDTKQPNTDFSSIFNEDQKSIFEKINYSYFIPRKQKVDNPYLSYVVDKPQRSSFSYGINLKYGQGNVRGSYGVTVYPATASYNPPEDCGLPANVSAADKISCKKFEGSDNDSIAYTSGGVPGSIQNTNTTKEITMYVKKDDMVIAIQTADTSAEEIYELVKSMEKISKNQIPQNTRFTLRYSLN